MTYDVLIVGGGPAGLSASIESARAGARVLLLDENHTLGGQLFKQIHKFFGSKEHYAGMRGTDIGRSLLEEAAEAGVQVRLKSKVIGIMDDGSIAVYDDSSTVSFYKGKKIILALGGKENALNFPGWTLPGVMTAGAAQTFVNVHNVLPGKRVLMIGSGNIGLITSYQLLQAGADVLALVDVLPEIKGYGVHAGKISRLGVPLYLRHTIREARGKDRVEEAVIAEVDEHFNFIEGTEKSFDADLILLAVGLSPRVELANMMGCRMCYDSQLGGHLVLHDKNMESSVRNVYVCGDLTGIEEASTALEEGRLAGIAAAESLGYMDARSAAGKKNEIWNRLNILRSGPFGEKRREAKQTAMEKV